MHLTKQDFSFKDAKREKVKSLRENNVFLSLVLSCNIDPRFKFKGEPNLNS